MLGHETGSTKTFHSSCSKQREARVPRCPHEVSNLIKDVISKEQTHVSWGGTNRCRAGARPGFSVALGCSFCFAVEEKLGG